MKWKVILCMSIVLSSSCVVIALSEIKSVSKSADAEEVIIASVDEERIVVPSFNEREKLLRSPELSCGSPATGRVLERSTKDSAKRSSDSGSNVSIGPKFLINDLRCRTHVYDAIQRNDYDRVKTLLSVFAFNEICEVEGLRVSYRTMRQLLPRLNELLKNALPPFPAHTHVDILCHFPSWRAALMGVFFDELRNDLLSATPQVLRARYYAVKWLEQTLKKLLQELLHHMASEGQTLLTPSVAAFLNPDFIEQTFEDFLYDQIMEKMSAGRNVVGSDAFEESTQSIGTLEQLELIERECQGSLVVRSAPKPLEAGVGIRASVAPQEARSADTNQQSNQVGQKRSRSPEISLGSPAKRRDFQYEGGASKENSSQNTSGVGSDCFGTPESDFLLTNPKSRANLYAALQKHEYDHVKTLLISMSCNKQLADPERVRVSHQIINQLLPRLNEILQEGLDPFPGYTYVDRLCKAPAWREAFMDVFIDELLNDLLNPSPQALRARYYAVKWLEATLTKLLQELLTLIDSERPVLLTPAVKCLLNPELVPQTFEYGLYEHITNKIDKKSVVKANSGDSDAFEKSTQRASIFEKLELLEKQGATPTKNTAQNGFSLLRPNL